MNALCIILLAMSPILLAGQDHFAATEPTESLEPADDSEVLEAIVGWARLNEVEVTDEASRALGAKRDPLKIERIGRPRLARDVELYLYEIRDSKRTAGKNDKIITLQDIESTLYFSFKERQLQENTCFTCMMIFPDPAYLTIVSVPARAEILIDGIRQGYTIRKFALSPAAHRIEVRYKGKVLCVHDVVLNEDEERELLCRSDRRPTQTLKRTPEGAALGLITLAGSANTRCCVLGQQ